MNVTFYPKKTLKNERKTTGQKKPQPAKKSKKKEKLTIDFNDIANRIVPLPTKERDYDELYALNDARLVLVSSTGHHDEDDEEEEGEDDEQIISRTTH